MKIFHRLLAIFILALFAINLQVMPVKADEAPFEFNQVEDGVRTKILQDRDVVDVEGQTISGKAIVNMWQDAELKDIPFFKIKNAVIQGDINAEGINLPFMVQFINCIFFGNINLENTTTKTFRIDNDSDMPSKVFGSLRMGRAIVTGDLGLYESEFYGPVTLFDAKISGNLFARGSTFRGTKWDDKKSKYAFELWTIEVGEATEFSEATFMGYMMAADAVFGQDARFNGVTFEDQANFTNFKVGELANFANTTFKNKATFENGIVSHDLQLSGAIFNGEANFNNLSVGRFFNLSNTPLNMEDFDDRDSQVSHHLPKSGAQFLNSVQFEGVQVGNKLDFTQAQYQYQCPDSNTGANSSNIVPFKLNLAEVSGQAVFTAFQSCTGLDLSQSQVGDLDIRNVTWPQFIAQDLSVMNSTTFVKFQVSNELNLSSADLGSLIVDGNKFWPDPDKSGDTPIYRFNLRNTTYTDINFVKDMGDNKLAYQEFRSGILMDMVAASEYSPQTYQTFKTFLIEKGSAGAATQLEYKRKERERKEILAPQAFSKTSADNPSKNFTPYLRSLFLLCFSGYGEHPEYALGWGMLVVLFGAIFFYFNGSYVEEVKEETPAETADNASTPGSTKANRPARKKNEEQKQTREITGRRKFYSCLLYSAALFFPLALLDFAENWEPASRNKVSFKLYQLIHKALGWIIAPTAVLAFGGWIK